MPNMQLVVFQLGDQYYAVEIDYVNGINKVKDFNIMKVPNAPNFVEGLINLRGKILPLYNLRKRFFNEDFLSKDNEILVVRMKDIMVGLIVDEVFDIISLEEKDAEPATNLFLGIDSRFISHIGKTEDQMIIILDVPNILSQTEQQEITPMFSTEKAT
ncbi:chemotaxis signal transduction protein CheW [Clostridium aceticum]|uniref:Chemotaxis signal transduction protein CheW n=1 Tax=Clostridium aceticum TaxID=84022 RepID=A0A0D8I9F8_9CLOT|nr:chemotaxis protein CheW [Clostridium aceticum]AKL96279.1 chemotaxis signal transduction protein CheW [Clostridium aceticum]KJF26677.1 hypothetical protein TZ02_12520 [Clostridium aceticum]